MRPSLDLNGLGLGINDIAVRSLRFRHDDALAGFQAGDADLAVFVRPEDAIGVTDQRAVRVGDLEFRVGEGHTGVHGTDLADQEDAIRGVVKTDGDNTLLTTVRQIDRFRGVDDGVPIGGVNLLHDIGAAFQPRPDGGAVLAGDLLPDGRAAGAGGAAQNRSWKVQPGSASWVTLSYSQQQWHSAGYSGRSGSCSHCRGG